MTRRPSRPSAAALRRALERLPSILVTLTAVPVVAVVAATPLLSGPALDEAYRWMQVLVALLVLAALLLGAWHATGEHRRVCLSLAVMGALVAYSLFDGGIEVALAGPGNPAGVLFSLAIVGAIGLYTPLLSRGAPRRVLLAAWLDTGLFLASTVIVLGVAWGVAAGSVELAAPGMLAALVLMTAWACAAMVMLLARDVRPRLGGAFAMVGGIGAIAVSALAHLATMQPTGFAPTYPPLELLFAGGVVLGTRGALTWSLEPDPAMARSFLVHLLRDARPTAAIMVSGVLYVTVEHGLHGSGIGLDIARLAVAAGVVAAGGRQALLQVEERRARRAEEAAAAELAAHVAERQQVTRALAGIEAAGTIEGTAQRVCDRAIQLPGVGFAVLTRLTGDGTWIPVAAAGMDAARIVGRPLSAEHGRHLSERLHGGAWREPASPWLDPYLDAAHQADVARMAMAADGRTIGLLTLGCESRATDEDGQRGLLVVREAAVVATALLAPALAAEEALAARRARIDTVIADQAFHPVYQPIVELATGAVRGYEALTRFDDGRRPDLVFQEAAGVGRGIDLELATLASAARDAAGLPEDAYLTVNLSPELASRPELLGPLLTRLPRDVMLEITEHVPVADYELLIASVYALDLRVRVAVDDAGAGYAGLTHILAVRPHVVKLDVSLVRSVDLDLARQALVGSMVSFTQRTGAVVVAEGVETLAEAAMLRRLGVTYGQGYVFGRPEPIEVVRAAATTVPAQTGRARRGRASAPATAAGAAERRIAGPATALTAD